LPKLNLWLASILWPNQDEKDSVLRARLETTAANISTNEVGNIDQQYIYRIKGVISIQHSKIPNDYNDEDSIKYICSSTNLDRRRYIVQAVNDLWDVTPASDQLCWNEEETRCCKLVVIGKWLDEDRLRREFEECFCAS
jgi:G3E family GTPase